MKKLVLLLALVFLCGCPRSMEEVMRECQENEASGQALMKFPVGDLVNIKLGGQGMILDCSSSRNNYLVRTGPAGHYECRWFDEFELEKP